MTEKNKRLHQRPADLRSLAGQLGLSQSTVSRALRAHPGIPEVTRQRVKAAAEAAGYRPNARARSLATGRTEAVGLVFPIERLQLKETNFVDVLAGISSIVTQRNYGLLLSPFVDDESSVLRKLASSKAVDGVIITRGRVNDARIALLNDLGLPYVLHGRSRVDLPYSFVDIDNFSVFERLTGLLLDFGHRHIAALNAPAMFHYAAARADGFRHAHAARGLTAAVDAIVDAPMTERSGHEHAMRLLAAEEKPTGLVCGSVFLARGVYRAAAELGLRIGEDLSVVCHDDELRSLCATDFSPPLTATQSTISAAGEQLAAILIDLAESKSTEPVRRIVPFDLILRQSAAAAKSTTGR